MISKTPKEMGFEIARKFEAIETQLKAKTNNPEDVDALKQAMVTMPMKIHELSGEIESTEVYISILKNQLSFIYVFLKIYYIFKLLFKTIILCLREFFWP